MPSLYAKPTLKSGYAETSSRRYAKEPETVVVGDDEIKSVRYVGLTYRDNCTYHTFKIPNKKRYYFQLNLY